MVSFSSTGPPPTPFFSCHLLFLELIQFFLADGKCKGQSTGTISEGIFGLAASCASA